MFDHRNSQFATKKCVDDSGRHDVHKLRIRLLINCSERPLISADSRAFPSTRGAQAAVTFFLSPLQTGKYMQPITGCRFRLPQSHCNSLCEQTLISCRRAEIHLFISTEQWIRSQILYSIVVSGPATCGMPFARGWLATAAEPP